MPINTTTTTHTHKYTSTGRGRLVHPEELLPPPTCGPASKCPSPHHCTIYYALSLQHPPCLRLLVLLHRVYPLQLVQRASCLVGFVERGPRFLFLISPCHCMPCYASSRSTAVVQRYFASEVTSTPRTSFSSSRLTS